MARLVFMGTPEFAVPVLDALARSEHFVAGVFTRPDQPAGRGKMLHPSPTKQLAQMRGLPVFQPSSLRQPEAVDRLKDWNPDLVIVAAYGLILPPNVLAIPPLGCVNTHASLLPRYRGAAPIPAALLAGDAETGVTLMQMDAGLDTGPILVQRVLPITPEDTTGSLTPKLARLASDLLIETLPRILAGTIVPQPQDTSRASVFGTLRKEQGRIDWSLAAVEIERRVRAFDPWPGAFTYWNGAPLKVLSAAFLPATTLGEPGHVHKVSQGVAVATGNGALLLRQVQIAGKKAMGIDEFLRGQRNFVGATLGV